MIKKVFWKTALVYGVVIVVVLNFLIRLSFLLRSKPIEVANYSGFVYSNAVDQLTWISEFVDNAVSIIFFTKNPKILYLPKLRIV